MVALPRALYTSLFRGRQRMAINNTIDVGIAAIQQIGILLVLQLGGGVFAVALSISAVMFAGVLIYMVIAARMFGPLSLVPRFDAAVIRRNLRFTALMASNSLLSLVHSSVDRVVVSKLLAISEFGFYGFASATVGRALFVTAAITQAAYPSFSTLSRTDRPALNIQYRKVQDLVTYVTVPLFAGIVFAALPLYTYLFNASVAQRLLLPTAFLCLGFALNSASTPALTLSLAVGRPQIFVQSNVVALFVTVPIAVALTVLYGISGAAFSFVVYNLFTYLYAIPRVCRQCLDISPWRWYEEVAKPFGLAAAVYALGWVAIGAVGEYSLIALVVSYTLASALYAAGAFLLVGEELRYTLSSVQRAVRSRLSLPTAAKATVAGPGTWQWGRTAVVGTTGIALGALLGGLSYAHPPAAALWMAIAVVVAAAVFMAALGTTLGVLVLLVVTCFIDQYVFGVRGLNVRPEQVAAGLAVIVFVFERLRSGRGLSLRPDFAEGALIAWFGVGLLSSVLNAPDRSGSLKVLALLVVSSAALFLPRRLLNADGALVSQVVGWTLLCFAAESGYAVLAYFLHLFGPSVSIGLNPATGHLDAFGTLWEPNVLGAIAGAGAVLWIYLGPRYFTYPWIGVALCMTACVASFARAAWLAGLLILFLTLVTPVRRRLDLRAFGFGSLVATVLTIGIFAADEAGSYSKGGATIGSGVANATDIIGRLRQFVPVFADLKGTLLVLGGGTNSFGERHALGGIPEHLGNLELMVLNDTGLIGVLLFAAFGISILIAAWRVRSDIHVMGLGATMLVLVLTNTSTETLELMITWLLVGLLLAAVDGARSSQPATDASQSSRYRLVTSSQL